MTLTAIPPQTPAPMLLLGSVLLSLLRRRPGAFGLSRGTFPPSAPGKPIRFLTRSDVSLLLHRDPHEAGNKLLIFSPRRPFR